MSQILKTISIHGFKSIARLDDFDLGNINVLIGSNGAGKSNFIGFFRMLRELIEGRLQIYLAQEGGADACLYLGPKETQELSASLSFGVNGYEFSLVPTFDGRLAFQKEAAVYRGYLARGNESKQRFGAGHFEARLPEHLDDPGVSSKHSVPYYTFEALNSWVVYHFHDTSSTSKVRRPTALNDNEALRPNAENLAAFLFLLQRKHSLEYTKIRDVVRLAAPFFDDFKLRPMPLNPELIQLEWSQVGSMYPMRASQLSDGTLRFICLATALLQPDRPSTMLFDEPELGLHPYALALLGSLIRKPVITPWGAAESQVILATQSALLLNEFSPEEIIVADRSKHGSVFTRLASDELEEWLSDYTLGELWQKNLLGGRPHADSLRRIEDHKELSQ